MYDKLVVTYSSQHFLLRESAIKLPTVEKSQHFLSLMA
jgi:hypothetical protein